MRTNDSGFTMVEMLIALVIGSIVLTAVYQTLSVQTRSYRQVDAIVTTQQTTRLGTEVLASELREASAAGGDLMAATSSSLKLRVPRKVGIVCAADNNYKWIDVSMLGHDGFAAGDSLLVYTDRDTLTASDDTWSPSIVEKVQTSTSCGGLLGGALGTVLPGGELSRLKLPAGAPVRLDSVYSGALVRSFEVMTYGIYPFGDEWMIGRVEQNGDTTMMVGPVAPPADGGLHLAYYDTLSNELTPTTAAIREDIARIRLRVRGSTKSGAVAGQPVYRDSLVTSIFIRGN